MKIGYARVSTQEQNLDLQQDALKKAGCEKIIVDTASGKNSQREGLAQLKLLLRAGDILVVWRLDRLGRSLKNLIEWMNYLEEEQVGFESLQEAMSTTTSTGKLIFHIFGALAEFERNLILERTKAGLAAARARGRLGGRKKALSPEKRRMVYALYQGKQHPIKEICEMFGISKPTLYQYVKEIKAEKASEAN
ncbi:MAG: recombinase family protein [Aureispira sp.]